MGSNQRGNKSICIAFESEAEYEKIIADEALFRDYLERMVYQYRELFPKEIGEGYKLHGFVESKKQKIKIRRIKLKDNGSVYQIRPSFMMPYMIERTQEVEKALYLRLWGVPFEALAYVFGRDPMLWYRAYLSLGKPSIVGTTIKDSDLLPKDLLADEKHTWIRSKKIYAATTVADGCLL